MSYAEEYVNALSDKFTEDGFRVEQGKRFDKIVQLPYVGSLGRAHAFVEKNTGFLIKAATWKAPQKSIKHPSGLAVRYDLSTPSGFTDAITQADRFGGYLYEK